MTISIHRWLDCSNRERRVSGLDEVFFQSSNTQTFADDATRAKFRARWLGRYLTHYPEWFYVAIGADGCVAGYLAGCLDDPAQLALFSDIAHFKTFAHLTREYPAHLHVNLRADCRNAGVGSELVSRFCEDARYAGAPGAHVMTGAQARNVGFYSRNGFHELAVSGEGPAAVVFLARPLT